MITCENCGLTDIEEVIESHKCGDFSQDNADTFVAPADERPDGQSPIIWGKLMVGFGFVMALFSAIAAMSAMDDVYSFSSDYTVLKATQEAARYWGFAYIGGAILSLGILLWSVGYIVYAISFLPQSD